MNAVRCLGGSGMENYQVYRRALHQIPEICMQEKQTGEYLFNHMQKMPCLIERVAENGLLCFFDNHQESTIAFRADMDALPVAEQTGLPFASTNGAMHACGHDGHMSMLLCLADYLKDHYQQYHFNILLIFQPAEESIGGASQICASGAMERYRVQSIFGLHLWPGIP